MTGCIVDDCGKPSRNPGCASPCHMHYNRVRVYGSTELPAKQWMKDQLCRADDCDRNAAQHDYCAMHAERWRNHGDPAVVLLVMGNPEKRFSAKVDKDSSPDGCWLWTGWVNQNGYGQFSINGGEKWAAHRYAYTKAHGEIPEGLTIDHVYARGCRNRHCVNPDHLEAVTQSENNARKTVRANQYWRSQ